MPMGEFLISLAELVYVKCTNSLIVDGYLSCGRDPNASLRAWHMPYRVSRIYFTQQIAKPRQCPAFLYIYAPY